MTNVNTPNIPPVISLHEAATLDNIRSDAQDNHKAAILPFYIVDGKPHMVVYAPMPQRNGDTDKILAYQIARGTMQAQYCIDGKQVWLDKGRTKPPSQAEWVMDEAPAVAALREAEEELGLPSHAIHTLYDCGRLPYTNPGGTAYSLHMFLAYIDGPHVLTTPDPYASAARLDNLTLENARSFIHRPPATLHTDPRPFKASYLALVETLHETITQHCT